MANAASKMALDALAGLLGEFRKGNIVEPRAEREGIERHAGELSARWDRRFPGFPQEYFPFTSLRGLLHRDKRDAHLKNIIVRVLNSEDRGDRLLVNVACVFGRHARELASRLKSFRVIGTDIDPGQHRLYGILPGIRKPGNVEFRKDDLFDPQVKVTPTAVVFFGACGSVSDAAMDYALNAKTHHLMCRTCCHENIGGNTRIVRRLGWMNLFFRFKNLAMREMRRRAMYAGFYFSDKYSRDDYPRSEAGRGLSNSDEFLNVCRKSVDSDICRTIIDLDRYLRLVEEGYDVWYRGELFVAERTRAAVT
jgi:hypothetical protein